MTPSRYHTIRTWGSLVKFSHTIFAMPFALSMALVVSRTTPISFTEILNILLALVAARTAAMAFNRLVDRDIDAKNPRTLTRELPCGKLTPQSVCVLLVLSSALFLFAASMLGIHCLMVAPLVLGWLFFYSWTKRFTKYAHVVLGVALALAPGGVWYALTGRVAVLPLYMMAGVALWVAGFDIIYSCQDVQFDSSAGLYSIPAAIGVPRALWCARVLHVVALAALALFGWQASLGEVYFIGLVVFALIVASQHLLVSGSDLSRVDAAFFSRNGAASVLYFFTVALDRFF